MKDTNPKPKPPKPEPPKPRPKKPERASESVREWAENLTPAASGWRKAN
jgi:hypothetical protein